MAPVKPIAQAKVLAIAKKGTGKSNLLTPITLSSLCPQPPGVDTSALAYDYLIWCYLALFRSSERQQQPCPGGINEMQFSGKAETERRCLTTSSRHHLLNRKAQEREEPVKFVYMCVSTCKLYRVWGGANLSSLTHASVLYSRGESHVTLLMLSLQILGMKSQPV